MPRILSGHQMPTYGGETMEDKIYPLKFSKADPLLVQKAERKNRRKQEVDTIIFWLTGYDKGEYLWCSC